MESIFSSLIENELKSIRQRKPRYSLRAFAKHLGISPSSLSKVINGTQRFSPQMAVHVARRLNLSAAEVERFKQTALTEGLDVRNKKPGRKRKANASTITRYDIEIFEMISNWYHFALLEWISMRPGKLRIDVVADCIGIEPQLIADAIERLLKFKFIRQLGKGYQATSKALSFGDEAPSRAIRGFHAQMIAKAAQALDDQSMNERNVSSLILRVNAKKYEKLVSKVLDFRNEIALLTDDDSDADQIYALNLQLFALAKLPQVI